MPAPKTRDRYNLPPRPFFYTLDQLVDLLQMPVKKWIFYYGINIGRQPDDKILARNIAPEGTSPEWRVEEDEFIRWLRHKRIVPPIRQGR